ncbi:MAG: flagellar biosynthetic protein FliR [Planctomycetaceae bacterium]|nr:flagellar biosynthetic protein FliR [Planctomycetaceae bacterium]
MELLLQLYTHQFLVFVLVLTRVSGLVVLAPVWGSTVIPARVRALLAIGMALIISPLCWHAPLDDPGNVLHLLLLVGGEFAVGLSLGLAVYIYFAGLEVAGQLMGQMSGMSLADVVSPTSDTNVSVFSQFLNILVLAVFVSLGGHQHLLEALLQTFQQMPPGQTHFAASLVDVLTDILTFSFVMGLQIAAPVMVALLLSIVIMGLISRTLPQLNVLAVGFSLNATVLLGALLLSLGILARVFHEQSFTAIDMMRPVFMRSGP